MVTTIDKRKRIPNSAIIKVAKNIAERYAPEKIILFGSYANGNFHPESDVDLLVVMDCDSPVQQAINIAQNVEHHFALDIIVKTPEQLEQRLKLDDMFVKEIMEEGKILYERRG